MDKLTRGWPSKEEYFVAKLAYGIARIAAAQFPKPVIVRTSDFKTNEYARLMGGEQFEPHEENPMLGWRGASRYYSDDYRDGFALECRALKRVRDEMGLHQRDRDDSVLPHAGGGRPSARGDGGERPRARRERSCRST